MNISNTEMQSLKDNGFLIKKNVFNINQIEKIKKIIKLNPEGRNRKNYFPINFKAFLIKAIKFDFKKITQSLLAENKKGGYENIITQKQKRFEKIYQHDKLLQRYVDTKITHTCTCSQINLESS